MNLLIDVVRGMCSNFNNNKNSKSEKKIINENSDIDTRFSYFSFDTYILNLFQLCAAYWKHFATIQLTRADVVDALFASVANAEKRKKTMNTIDKTAK